MEYKVVVQGVDAKRKLYDVNTPVYSIIGDNKHQDWYESIFIYNEAAKAKLEFSKSLAGIQDVYTNKLAWDFDSKDNLELARADALTLIDRLNKHNIPIEDVSVCFSGMKGYTVQVLTEDHLTVPQFKNICLSLAEGLPTNDASLYDPQRILRVPGTQHQESHLFKLPISPYDLQDYTSSYFVELAKDAKNVQTVPNTAKVTLPASFDVLKVVTPKKEISAIPKYTQDVSSLNFTVKPKGIVNCKWAIINGFFPEGTRDNALIAIAATYKGQGYSKETVHHLLKSVMEKQVARYGGEAFDKEHLWKKVETVFAPSWDGGSYSCKTTPWLTEICNSLGTHKCKSVNEETLTVSSDEFYDMFSSYAQDYDKNKINTGIKGLDEKTQFMVGTSSGILAPPSVGKSSLAFAMLNYNSSQNVKSIFFSYDMYHSMVYLRLLQKHTGFGQEKIFDIYKHDKKEMNRIREIIRNEYKHVRFCFKSGQNPNEIEQTIVDTEEKIGEKIKLVIIDYNELVQTEYADATAASAHVAQRLRQISNDRSVCAVSLLQPAKLFSDPSEESKTYQAAKGSGSIAQSLSLMLGMSRPGFNPKFPEKDRFMTINALKNRHGSVFTEDFRWDGLTGSITELQDDDKIDLNAIRENKAKAQNNSGGY